MHINLKFAISKYEQNLNLLMKYIGIYSCTIFLLGGTEVEENERAFFPSQSHLTRTEGKKIEPFSKQTAVVINTYSCFFLQISWFICFYYACHAIVQFVCGMKSQVLWLAYCCRSTTSMLPAAVAVAAAEYLYCRRKLLPWYARAVYI